MSDFKSLLIRTRKSRGLTQAQVADLLKLSSGQVFSNWERGYGRPMPIPVLKRLIDTFRLNSEQTLQMYIADRKIRLESEISKSWKIKQSP